MIHRRLAAIAAVAVVVSAAGLAGACTVTAAWGDLTRSSFGGTEHSPDCWVTWIHDVADGAYFDDTVDGGMWGTFELACAPDGLTYHGAWDTVESYTYFHRLWLDGEVGCTLEVTEPVRITVTRSLPVPLDPPGHVVEITGPDGAVTTLLGDDTADTAEAELAPGVHTIRIVLDVYFYNAEYLPLSPAYDGSVTVRWAGTSLPIEPAGWSRVKALYR